METVIPWIILIFFLIGAGDYILGNRFGIGAEFEDGILSAGRLLMCMAGFMVLAPVLAHSFGPLVAPFFRSFGADPSIIAGMLLANDSGGTTLALELADSRQAGLFSGLIVGSMLGTTVMFGIALTMSNTTPQEQPSAICGLLAGIITVPLGCLTGGFAAGFSAETVLFNTLPVLVLSVVLLILLARLGTRLVPAFTVLGKFLQLLSAIGLCCGAVQQLVGYPLIPGMDTLNSVFPVVGGIAVFLAGAFPLVAVIRKLFAPALNAVGSLLRTNASGVAGLLVGLANGLACFALLHKMDDRGRMFSSAVMVSASCLLGDHMAYTAQVAPELCGAVLLGKTVGGTTALLAAIILAPYLLEKSKKNCKMKEDCLYEQ